MRGAPPCTQAANPAAAFKAPPPPRHKERDTLTGAYTAAYACSNAALLTLPNVSCQQLGPLRTAVAAAEFPDAPPQPQAGPSTVRRHQQMLTRKIQGTFKSQLSKAPAVHVQMDGCTIKNGKVVLFCASASIPAPVPSLPTSSLTADPPTPLAADPPTPVAADPPTPLAADPTTPVAADPPTPLAADPPTPVAADPTTPLAADPTTSLAADPTTPAAADPPTPAQILTHGQEPSRILCRVLDIRKCPDSTAAAQAHDLEHMIKEANLWELLASVTVDNAASNVGRTGGLVALVNVSRRREGLALIIGFAASSWGIGMDLHPQMKALRKEHFFGAAPTSNAHVESALQHTKHGHGSKQRLPSLLSTLVAKTDPSSFRTMDAVDLHPQMKALRKEQRDMESASAAMTAPARAARKAVIESRMVGGNKQLVLNIGTAACLGQLREVSSKHPRGADYSATTVEQAATFTVTQLWGYINFYKIPPKQRPAQKTRLANLRSFVEKHIQQ
ncbi:hypothetical protein QJQ45_005406 [Haematococcus lacustris]|nr:hypothetical protein QJQ45_005406 [Haematococcus lacustris]